MPGLVLTDGKGAWLGAGGERQPATVAHARHAYRRAQARECSATRPGSRGAFRCSSWWRGGMVGRRRPGGARLGPTAETWPALVPPHGWAPAAGAGHPGAMCRRPAGDSEKGKPDSEKTAAAQPAWPRASETTRSFVDIAEKTTRSFVNIAEKTTRFFVNIAQPNGCGRPQPHSLPGPGLYVTPRWCGGGRAAPRHEGSHLHTSLHPQQRQLLQGQKTPNGPGH